MRSGCKMDACEIRASWMDGRMNWIEPFSTGNRRESMNGFGQSMAVMPDKKGAAETQKTAAPTKLAPNRWGLGNMVYLVLRRRIRNSAPRPPSSAALDGSGTAVTLKLSICEAWFQ